MNRQDDMHRMMRQVRYIIENGIKDNKQEKAADALKDKLSNRMCEYSCPKELKEALHPMVLMLDKKLMEYEFEKYLYRGE